MKILNFKVHQQHQIIAVAPLWLMSIVVGMCYGWLAPTIKYSFEKNSTTHVMMNDFERTCLVSANEFSRTVGIIFATMTVDRFGRMFTILGGATFCFVGWSLLSLTDNIYVIYVSRSMFGFTMALFDFSLPIYCGEVSSPEMRSLLIAVAVSSFMLGMLFGSMLAAMLPYFYVSRIMLLCSTVALASGYALRETPTFLILSKKMDKARRNFKRFFCQNPEDKSEENVANTELEFGKLVEFLEHKPDAVGWNLLKLQAYRKSIIIVGVLNLTVSMGGYWSLMSFITITLKPSKYVSEEEFSYICILAQLVVCLLSIYFLKQFKRRPVLLLGAGLLTLAHVISSILLFTHNYVIPVPFFSVFIWATVTFAVCLISGAIIPSIALLMGELFPQRIKSFGCCMGSLLKAFGSFLTSLYFLYVSNHYGMYANFLIFSSFCLVNFCVVYMYTPETKGKTLAEIQESWEKDEK